MMSQIMTWQQSAACCTEWMHFCWQFQQTLTFDDNEVDIDCASVQSSLFAGMTCKCATTAPAKCKSYCTISNINHSCFLDFCRSWFMNVNRVYKVSWKSTFLWNKQQHESERASKRGLLQQCQQKLAAPLLCAKSCNETLQVVGK